MESEPVATKEPTMDMVAKLRTYRNGGHAEFFLSVADELERLRSLVDHKSESNTAKKPVRPQALPSQTYEMQTACGPIYVTITHDENQIQELFIRYGRSGGCSSAIAGGMAKVISYALRSKMEPSLTIKALRGIRCHLGKNTCMHAIAMAISEEMGLPEDDDVIQVEGHKMEDNQP